METGLAAVIVILLGLLSVSNSRFVCQRGDCDRYDVPPGNDRVCRVPAYADVSTKVEWYAGTLDSGHRCPNYLAYDIKDFCPGYVGMNMNLWCDFANITSVIVKDGIPLTGGATVTFNSLRKEDEGLYQCRRNDSSEVLGEFNMTVRGKLGQV